MAAPGQLDKLDLVLESTYGTNPDTGYTDYPYDDFSILPENDATVLEKATGSRFSLYVDTMKQDVRGNLTVQVWPDNVTLAHRLIGLDLDSGQIRSYSMRWYNAADGNTYVITGAKCDTGRITISEGDPKLKMSMDFIAKSFAIYSGTDGNGNGFDRIGLQTLPSGASFELSDMSLWWAPTTITSADTTAAEEETQIEELTIELRHNLRPGGKRDNTSGFEKTIRRLDYGVEDAEVSGSIVMHLDSEQRAVDYMNYVISRNTGLAIGVKFDYPGTGSPADKIYYSIRDLVLRKIDPPASIREVKVMRFNGVVKAKAVGQAPVVFSSTAWPS